MVSAETTTSPKAAHANCASPETDAVTDTGTMISSKGILPAAGSAVSP